ncbi:MAG: cysteine--tRNA ligase [Candidatus Kerfeldbacteria bacterium RIFCSPLOWO2_01_FULL_48_11]|uniref:Cysteine--tRNA ligase n=1 Tax=Candidatus Kerfeldbacteria bacterium RIFCSPLOWO2_01_FULL_48_11 TaxID=1798543 RepID=A0A1G2B4J6_9BACT|nr:MAG: Cysteine-tRNA ligase [Parcubacteria group bacterium GW2011_GWA2_48_9]KKW14741.1 MAG: Cysteine-tRNA ligase [Parcubacteria group bacterium GW2011_GWC2_49_9]OGY83130.1 MAG: cysteine--tRNA ligase [Candidatus Kerfeldbacteria bacterium RIFCSPLOWO2_01_FULL_48_11]HCJ52239.1 cysteine--tRNA ligase [Candidatus Kerfeldbacteria bacterium]
MLQLYNTLTRMKEPFTPLKPGEVSLYTCGPTVYNYAHIGNLRTYIFEDLLKRVLSSNEYRIKHVMNITDVGHLTSDADEGEDKMEKGAAREHKTVWEVAEFYTKEFKNNLADLNISEPDVWCKATDHIKEQVAWVQKLEEKGFTYITSDGVYFDTNKLPNYGKLTGQKLSELKEGARVEKNSEKRNPTDFALWKFSPKGSKRQMEWESPWGKGFPGWHLECSVMARKYLGETIDIHCGGIDHIPVHHTNEIAQVEAVTGKPFVRIWMHGAFLEMDKTKMAKSGENFITLQTLKDKKIQPLSYRYFCLGTHYRKRLNFSWEALEAAQNGYENLCALTAGLGEPKIGCAEFEKKFTDAVNDDLNMPKALGVVWDMLKSSNPPHAKKASLLKFDEVLGLNLKDAKPIEVPDDVRKLMEQREELRKQKKWDESDQLRDEIADKGFRVEDTPAGTIVKQRRRV